MENDTPDTLILGNKCKSKCLRRQKVKRVKREIETRAEASRQLQTVQDILYGSGHRIMPFWWL